MFGALWGAVSAPGAGTGEPASLQATAGSQPPVIATLTWNPPAGTTPELYHIYVGWSPTGPFHLKGRTTDTSWIFINGMTATSYYFRVVAVDENARESAPAVIGPVIATWSRSPHSQTTAYSTRCAQCHSTHEAGDTLVRLELVTTETVSTSCLVCHDGRSNKAANIVGGTVDSFGLPSGHRLGTPTAGRMKISSCSTCHDTHGIAEDSRMIPAKKINGTSVSTTGNQECFACHNSTGSWYGPGYPSTAAPTRDSSGYPVSGRWTGPATYNAAASAHSRIPETTQTVSATQPIRRDRGDCLYCHSAHRGPNKYDALKANYTVVTSSTLAADKTQGASSALCFTCHGGATPSGFATAPANIKQFAAGAAPTAGHNILTAGGTLPVGASLPCFECHNPHGSQRGNLRMLSDERGASLRTDTPADVRRFCFTCHTTSNTRAGWNSSQGIYVRVDAAATVVGLSRTAGVLRLPTVQAAHTQTNGQSCYDCHGGSYAPGGNNVHGPTDLGAPGAAAVAQPLSVATTLTTQMTEAGVGSDMDAPITLADTTNSTDGTILLAATDIGSGVAATYYSLDGADAIQGTEVIIQAEGSHSLEYWSADAAGNVEARNSLQLIVDRTPPVTLSDAVASYDASASITLSATDTVSGVAETRFVLDGGQESTSTLVATSVDGTHTLLFWSVDRVGNVEPTQTVEFSVVGGLPAEPAASFSLDDWLSGIL